MVINRNECIGVAIYEGGPSGSNIDELSQNVSFIS